MVTKIRLTPEDLELLTEDERDEEERESRPDPGDYPEPNLEDILEIERTLDQEWAVYLDGDNADLGDQKWHGPIGLAQVRKMRYQRDQLPAKWQQLLNTPYRVRSRLVQNEIMRVVALAIRNQPKAKIAPNGSTGKAQDRANRQTRWANQLLPALLRQARQPLQRMFVDATVEAGLGVWEYYRTEAYDDLEPLPDDLDDPAETRRWNRDRDEQIKGAGLPFGIRHIDPASVRLDFDDEGPCVALVKERKRYRHVYEDIRKRSGPDKIEELRMPKPGKGASWPGDGAGGARESIDDRGEVETLRYYDKVYYAYVVGGRLVEVKKHGLPGLPIISAFGLVTSSSNLSERLQGAVWGMAGLEQAINDFMTIALDIAATFARPKPVIETELGGDQILGQDGKPSSIDLSGKFVPQLAPGQKIRNAFEGFTSQADPNVFAALMQFFQLSGLNPVSAGESPGADVAGYTIANLQSAANALYESILDNYALAVAQLIDFARQDIRDGLGETVFLSVPMENDRAGGTEWLGLGPDDIDETPCEVAIDPMSDVNRLAIRDSLIGGMQQGIVPREVVQRDGYGAEDPEAWDEQILEDATFAGLGQLLIEEAMAIVYGGQPMPPGEQQPPGGGAPQGEQQGARVGNGGKPAQPQPPTVGAQNAQGSQVSGRNSARARGGQQPPSQGVPAGSPR